MAPGDVIPSTPSSPAISDSRITNDTNRTSCVTDGKMSESKRAGGKDSSKAVATNSIPTEAELLRMDHYEVLGVDADADLTTIKRGR